MKSEPSWPPRKLSALAWLIFAIVLGFNFWLDYYHPLGWVLDVVILVALAVKSYRKSQK